MDPHYDNTFTPSIIKSCHYRVFSGICSTITTNLRSVMQMRVREDCGDDNTKDVDLDRFFTGFALCEAASDAFDRSAYEVMCLTVDGVGVDPFSTDEQAGWTNESIVRIRFVSTIDEMDVVVQRELSTRTLVFASPELVAAIDAAINRIPRPQEFLTLKCISDDDLKNDRGWTEVATAAIQLLPQNEAGRYFNLAAGTVVLVFGLRVMGNLGKQALEMLDRSSKTILKMVKDGQARLELSLTHVTLVPIDD